MVDPYLDPFYVLEKYLGFFQAHIPSFNQMNGCMRLQET